VSTLKPGTKQAPFPLRQISRHFLTLKLRFCAVAVRPYPRRLLYEAVPLLLPLSHIALCWYAIQKQHFCMIPAFAVLFSPTWLVSHFYSAKLWQTSHLNNPCSVTCVPPI